MARGRSPRVARGRPGWRGAACPGGEGPPRAAEHLGLLGPILSLSAARTSQRAGGGRRGRCSPASRSRAGHRAAHIGHRHCRAPLCCRDEVPRSVAHDVAQIVTASERCGQHRPFSPDSRARAMLAPSCAHPAPTHVFCADPSDRRRGAQVAGRGVRDARRARSWASAAARAAPAAASGALTRQPSSASRGTMWLSC